ncbi:MAG: hypothetical protein V4561_01585 [Bacteroidota bacterium]
MKKLLLMFIASLGLTVQAQELVGKKTRKKSAKTTRVTNASPKVREPENYQSRNGKMKVHYIDKNEVLDTTTQPGGQPPHVNQNYNEIQPALSPSNGSK